jgi:hypothetical protein
MHNRTIVSMQTDFLLGLEGCLDEIEQLGGAIDEEVRRNVVETIRNRFDRHDVFSGRQFELSTTRWQALTNSEPNLAPFFFAGLIKGRLTPRNVIRQPRSPHARAPAMLSDVLLISGWLDDFI